MLRNGPWQVFLIGALALLMGGILSPGLGPALQAQQNYTRDANWPQYPSDMTFEMGTGNAVSADGVIYTVSRDIHQRGAVVRALDAVRRIGRRADDESERRGDETEMSGVWRAAGW